MASTAEKTECYASPAQREVLLTLITHPVIEESFFLTGGTALSVFYLHHRVSEDIDLFALETISLAELGRWISITWPGNSVRIQQQPLFMSFLINEVKVDFVVDRLSFKEERPRVLMGNGHFLTVDSMHNIASNKLCALASRMEPKDFIDFYYIMKTFPELDLDTAYLGAGQKDAIFDDPPTAAFQIEENLGFMRQTSLSYPGLLQAPDEEDFRAFYENLVKYLYGRGKP